MFSGGWNRRAVREGAESYYWRVTMIRKETDLSRKGFGHTGFCHAHRPRTTFNPHPFCVDVNTRFWVGNRNLRASHSAIAHAVCCDYYCPCPWRYRPGLLRDYWLHGEYLWYLDCDSMEICPQSKAKWTILSCIDDALCFLLLARYVPNVAKRLWWEQCNIEDRPTDRPTSHFGKFRTAISRQRVIRSTSCLVLG